MTTLDSSKEIQKNNSEENEKHEDFRMFGLITFLIADGMTFAGFFAAYLTYKAVNPLPDGAIYELSLIHISEPTRQPCIAYAVFCL